MLSADHPRALRNDTTSDRPLRTTGKEPRQADHEADGGGGRKRSPSPLHEHHRRDRQRPDLQHHRRPEGDAAAHVVVAAFDERDTPRCDRDRHEVEALIQERQEWHPQHQIDRSRWSTPSPPHGRGRGQSATNAMNTSRIAVASAPLPPISCIAGLREHVFDGEVSVRRAGRGGDLLDPKHVDVGDWFAGHLRDRVPEDREADRDED